MLRHQRSMHTDEYSGSDSEVQSENSDVDISDQENEEATEDDAIDPWDAIVQEAFDRFQSEFEERVKDYVSKENVQESDVRQIVFEDMWDIYRKAMMNIFIDKMLWFAATKREPVFTAIRKSATDLKTMDDYDDDEAWKSATSKRKFLFDKILKRYEPPELADSSKNSSQAGEEGKEGGRKQEGGRDSITMPSLAQQTVEQAKSELERMTKKRKYDNTVSEDITVIGKTWRYL